MRLFVIRSDRDAVDQRGASGMLRVAADATATPPKGWMGSTSSENST